MRHRILVSATTLLAVLAPGAAPAFAEGPLKGTVSSTWVTLSPDRDGDTVHVRRVRTAARAVYVWFEWERAPTAGQRMVIEFRDPKGRPRARWTTRTLARDQARSRVYTFIRRDTFEADLGAWSAVLTVGGTARGRARFTVVQ